MSPTPTDGEAEGPPPAPVEQRRDRLTEDYLRGDMAVFEIEGVLFRVPKCLFEPGPGKFKPFLSDGKEEDGNSDEGAVPLPDLTADEFRALIDFFLPYRCLGRKEPTLQYWINLLSVSTNYELELIRPVAIEGINTHGQEVDPVEKYVLATKYRVKEWEASSFERLCQRPDPLTVEEAEKLGVVVVTKVFREREKIRSKSDMTNDARLSQPSVESVDPPHDSGTAIVAPDHGSGLSKGSRSSPVSGLPPASSPFKFTFKQ